MVKDAVMNPNLKDFWTTPSRFKILYGGRDSTKCLALGTKVIMFDYTLKNVEDIKVGDTVMGVDGTKRNVLSTTTGTSKMYKISQFTGNS